MGQNRGVAGDDKVKKELLHPHRRDVVGRLDQYIARISEGQKASGPEPSNKIRRHVHICTSDETQRNAISIKGLLQRLGRFPDLGTGVMV